MEPRSIVKQDLLQVDRHVYYMGGTVVYPQTPSIRNVEHNQLTCSPNVSGDKFHPTPHSFTKRVDKSYTGSFKDLTYYNQNHYEQWYYSGNFGYPIDSIPEGLPVDPIFNEALERVNAKFKNGANLTVDAIQAGQTLALVDYARKGVELGIYGKKRAIKKVGEAWLEYIYGWKPLVSSIYDTVKVATEVSLGDGLAISGQAHRAEQMRRTDYTNVIGRYGLSIPTQVDIVRSTRVRIGLNVNTDLGPSMLSRLASFDPAVLAWELLPFSFIVDWVYDIGGYVSMLEQAYKYQGAFNFGHCTVTNLVSAKARAQGFRQGPGSTDVRWDYSASSRHVSKIRTVLNNWPSPRKPSINVDFGATRATTTAALLSLTIGDKSDGFTRRNYR